MSKKGGSGKKRRGKTSTWRKKDARMSIETKDKSSPPKRLTCRISAMFMLIRPHFNAHTIY